MRRIIDRIKLNFIEREFNKLYNLALENSSRTEKLSFSDGTPYTEEELNNRMLDIGKRIERLRLPTDNLGILHALAKYKVGFLELGAERLIQLYNREPEFIQHAIIRNYNYTNEFTRTKFFEGYSKDKSIDEILKEWFEITALQIEDQGIHMFTEVWEKGEFIRNDVTRYGESFIKAYSEFFVEDRGLPEEIKQKFYNARLTIEDYEKYKDQFDGILIGIGIEDETALSERIGERNLTELIRYDSVAMKYFEKNYHDSRLWYRDIDFDYEDDLETVKAKFQDIIEDELKTTKKELYEDEYGVDCLKKEEFFRIKLPELFLDDNAPKKLMEEYNDKSLALIDLNAHIDWIEYLKGKDEYIKACCIDESEYINWKENFVKHSKEEVNNYMSLLYEEEIRQDIIRGEIDGDSPAITDIFKSRNQDIIFDDLPRKLKTHFINQDWTFDDVFALSKTKRELLRGKQIYAALEYDSREFCDAYGGDFEAFEVYEKYAGLMELLVKTIYYDGNEKEPLEEMIKKYAVSGIARSTYPYDDRVPEEYKREHSKYFLDPNAPDGLKKMFYRWNDERMTFKYLRENPDYIPFLERKSIRQLFDVSYNEFFDFCNSEELAKNLGIKYGDFVTHLSLSFDDGYNKDKEQVLRQKIYELIKEKTFDYRDLPEDFKSEYPELFLMEEDIAKLANQSIDIADIEAMFYSKKIEFTRLREQPQLIKVLKNKDLCVINNGKAEYLLDLFNGDKKSLIELGIEYGNILFDYVFKLYYIARIDKLKDSDIRDTLDQLIYNCIVERSLKYTEELPKRFKQKYPKLFLFSEELATVDNEKINEFKQKFYDGQIDLIYLKDNPDIKNVIFNKNLDICAGNIGLIVDKFTEVVGDREKAFNLVTGKFAEKLEKIMKSNNHNENIEKAIMYYKEAGFIPELVIINKLPVEKIKGFALNRKLWSKIIAGREELGNDVLGSLLEATVVMGVFETKEFIRNGKSMIQGCGEEGFKKLQQFLNYAPDYYLNSFYDANDICAVEYDREGHIKIRGDYFEELLYEKIEKAAINNDRLEDLMDEELDSYDVRMLLEDIEDEMDITVEEIFREHEDDKDTYSCILDRKMNKKIKMLLKTIGIKNDEVLSKEEFGLIENAGEELVSRAFIFNKKSKTFRFNISQKEDKFIIGEKDYIDEEQSRENKRLFDYVKFLMGEYGLEADAARLGANNDRSNIDLCLTQDKMDRIIDGADRISLAARNRYSSLCKIWRLKQDAQYRYITNNMVHQLFDGLKMQYNEQFREFILKNIREITDDNIFASKLNSIQEKIIELSKDPDYAGIEITPDAVLRAMSKINFENKKVGFEKGEELAQKFAFSQEYFDVAQEVWEEARQRESSTIPRIQGQESEYSYEVLRLDDAMGIYVGNVTNCCQKLGGVGETAMLHSMKENHGRVFVVRDENKKVIAQSWLWRNGDTICFDNVEIPRNAQNQENQKAVHEILKKVAKKLCEKDSEIIDNLVAEGKFDEKTGMLMKAKKVTVGKGNTDIYEIANNRDKSIEDDECKYPIGYDKEYKGIDEEVLYTSDSRKQVILYKADNYIKQEEAVNYPIHYDENIEKNWNDITNAELKTIKEIDKEVNCVTEIENKIVLLDKYAVKPDELKIVLGTDWFVLYSEKENRITVHKMLKSPSSGIKKKSIREQREAVNMLIEKAKNNNKTLSMEIENDKVCVAANRIVSYMEKQYKIKVEDVEKDDIHRIQVSEIQMR